MTEQPDFAAVPEVTLGWRIRLALDHGQLKHDDLAAELEISRDTVSRWCRDVNPPKKFVLNQIAVLCGVSPRWLIDGIDTSRTPPDDGCPGPGLGKTVGYLMDRRSPATIIPLKQAM